MSHALGRFLALTVFLVSTHLGAQELPLQIAEGLKLFQEGKTENACEVLSQIESQAQRDSYLLYNLGYCAYRAGQLGLAIANWRKALALSPYFTKARQALEFSLDKLKIKQLPRQITAWETFRNTVLERVDASLTLSVSFFGLLGFGWSFLSFLGTRKRTVSEDQPAPLFSLNVGLWSLLALLGIGLSGAKWFDYSQPRGTIVTAKVEAKTGPGTNETTLFEIFEGLEVLLEDRATLDDGSEWYKITYPGGMTGWTVSNGLVQTSGKILE